MMDRNREARRAAAMANGLLRRRHRTTTSGSLRESPEDEGQLELQETAARLRDRTVKKERDREIRDRDRDHRERERDRLRTTKRRRGDKYREDGGVGGGDDDSSEESVNDEDEEDDDGRVRYVPPSNHAPMSSSTPASTLTSHRKSYPPPSKVYRVAPTWKAPDEMIGVCIPRKARSAPKRGHECWSQVGGITGEVSRQPSTSPVRSSMVVGGVSVPSPAPPPQPPQQPPPVSPSSSNVSIKKKIKVNNNGLKQRPPKPSSKSSPSIQDEIEIEVAEVLYGLKRQSQAPPKQDGLPNDSTKVESRSTADSKFRVSSPVSSQSPVVNNHGTPLTTVAPKRKRPRPYPDEIHGSGPRSSPIPSSAKAETDQGTKMEAASPSVEKSMGISTGENGGELVNLQEITVDNNGGLSDVKEGLVEESGGIRSGKVEEASSSPKLESPQINDRVEYSTTSTKPNSTLVEPENHREEKFEIDLMAPPQTSPEREEETAEYRGGDEKTMLTDKETEGQPIIKPKEEDDDNNNKVVVKSNKGGDLVELNTTQIIIEDKQLKSEVSNSKLNLNTNSFDLEKSSVNVNEEDKLIFQKQQPKITRDDASTDNMLGGGQSGTAPLPMSVPGGWHGGISPMGYVGPLQGVVSMDGTPMASPPIQSPHFLFTQPKPKRCATHCYIARSISVHQQMLKMNPFWPAPTGTAPLFNGKPYNLNMVPPPTDLHAAGRGVVVNSSQDKQGQPFTFFSSQPTPSAKDKSPQAPSLSDSAQKQFLLQPALPPGAPSNILHAPALFFPMGQQQAGVPNVRPGSTKSQSTPGPTASTSTSTSAPMGTTSNAGPAMSFSYPSMAGNETQFMAILGNSAYPFPIPAHVGAASPYRGTHPQAMPFFNGSFYSSQMLHPSQLQQQQQQAPQTSQSTQLQQQNQPNPASLSTNSSSSQKHLQNQQMRPQGNTTPVGGNSTQGGLQNFQPSKGRSSSQSHYDISGEGSPSTVDGRTRQNMSVYGQNFAMPFNSPNFALMTSGGGGGGGNNASVSNGNVGDKKQQQPQQNPGFPMSFATINGTTTPGLDMSSIAQNHAIIMSLPEASRQNYQIMAAQAAQHKKNSYRSPDDGKTGSGSVTETSNVDEERKAMAMRASAGSVGQSIAFSRDLSENSNSGMPGNTVVDSSARTINLVHGSYTRPSRSTGQNSGTTSNASNPSQQMLFSKQQQYVAPPNASSGRSKTSSSNGNVYPDHLASPSIMAAKFPNSLSGFPPLVQTSVAPSQSNASQWKNSVRPNASQVSSPSMATSTTSTMKNLPQQPGRSQQNHTQISFGPTNTTPKASSTPQGQQSQNNQMVGSPSTSSVSKGASGSPRTTASASTGSKQGGQGSTLSSQQGKSSQSPSLSTQKQSILGSPHHIMSGSSNSGVKPQINQSQLQAQFSKQNLQQAQLYFSSFMQPPSTTTSSPMAYPQRQIQGAGSKSQGPTGPVTSSSGMLSLCSQVSTSTSDPGKSGVAANNMKGSLNSQGMLQAAAQFAAQTAGGAHQLMPAGFPYVHAVSTGVQVNKSATEQKQPTGE